MKAGIAEAQFTTRKRFTADCVRTSAGGHALDTCYRNWRIQRMLAGPLHCNVRSVRFTDPVASPDKILGGETNLALSFRTNAPVNIFWCNDYTKAICICDPPFDLTLQLQ